MKANRSISASNRSVFFAFVALFLCVATIDAQRSYNGAYEDADRNLTRDSEAKKLLEQVTLPAEKIIEILSNEPGLTLQVKRAILRKVYEQGKLLNPEELTDAVLFELIRNDNNARMLATAEIEDRNYLRAKPTSEERANWTYGENGMEPPQDVTTGKGNKGRQTQEERFWNAQEKNLRPPASNTRREPSAVPPNVAPEYRSPAPVGSDPRLRRNVASMRNEDSDRFNGMSGGELEQIHPDELSAVLGDSAVTPASLSDRDLSGFGSSIPNLSSRDLRQNLAPDIAQERPNGAGELPLLDVSLNRQNRPSIPSLADADPDTNTTIRKRPNPYFDIPSLYDIYSQVSQRQPKLERFGARIFEDDNRNFDDLPMDLPVGPDYVLGPGDGVNIDIWGGVSQRLSRRIDREGRVSLPEVGTVLVAGKSLGEVQDEVQSALRTQFRDVRADVSIARLRTVRVYVVGDVLHPGAYDISALSTPLNALYAAGGPTQRGSLRVVQHLRGKEVVQQVDLYDLLLRGTRGSIKGLQQGDTILLPPVAAQVKVEGMVRRPAIYELNGEHNLAEVLELAGGVLPTGTLRHIEVERVEAHQSRKMLSLDIPETNDEAAVAKALEGFEVRDGDSVRISPILPYSDKTVFLDGHVFHPGKYPFTSGMKVTDLVKSYRDLLPEPYQKHAEIIRLSQTDFEPTVISFNLSDALAGKVEDLTLQPFDTVRIFGRFDFEDPPTISVVGEVRDPGVHRTNGVTRLSDAVYLAGGLTPEALLGDTQIFRQLPNGRVQVFNADLGLAIKGDEANNIVLESKDRVVVHRNIAKLDPPSVSIEGEVANPGKYPLGSNMTAADLVRLAGGFKRSAYTGSADLVRYVIRNGMNVEGDHQEVAIARAMAGEPDTDVRLREGDVLSIRQVGGWKNIGATITVKGELIHPGVYGIREGETLSSVLRRAGGFTAEAYPYGAVFERVQVRELAEKNRQELIRRIEAGGVNVSGTGTGQEQAALVQAAMQQQRQVLSALKNQPANGRMVIHVSAEISKWENTTNDIEVRAGDVINVPKRPNFVLVNGQVYNSSAITYAAGKNAGWYLRQAGGATELANSKRTFVVRADGSIVGPDSRGIFTGGVTSVKLRPGDTVIVPEKFVTGNSAMKVFLSSAQIFSSIALTAAVALN